MSEFTNAEEESPLRWRLVDVPLNPYDDVRLARLLSLLRPAPRSWVTRAQRIPAEERTLTDGDLAELARKLEINPMFRQRFDADPVAAAEGAGMHELGLRLERELRELGFLHTEEELKPFLEGEMPPAVEHNARACSTDVATYVAEGPGLSAYALSDGAVYRTYVTTARGLEPAMGYYGLLDRTPMGRNEVGEQVFWLRRHDEYPD